MKSINYYFLLFTLLSTTFCHGQNKITVKDTTNLIRTEFDDENNHISVSALRDGFNLRIGKGVFQKAEIKNKKGDWDEGSLGKKKEDSNYFTYEGIKIEDIPNSIVKVRLTLNDGSIQILNLLVSGRNKENGTNNNSGNNVSNDCESDKNYANKFGEDVRFYDDNTIVYIYDFNPKNPNDRNFYKITKVKNYNRLGEGYILKVKLKEKRRNVKNAKKEFRKNPTPDNEKSLKDAIHYLNDSIYEDGIQGSGLKIEPVTFLDEKLSPDKNVKFKIFNINRFMYDVSIADDVVDFGSDPSALFMRFFLGDNTLLNNLMETYSTETVAHKFKDTTANSLMKSISNFVNHYNNLKNTALNALNPCFDFPCCDSKYDYYTLLSDLSSIKAKEEMVKRKLNEVKSNLNNNNCSTQLKLKAHAEYTVNNLSFAISRTDMRIEETKLNTTKLENELAHIAEEIKVIESLVFYSIGADSLTKRARLVSLGTEASSKKMELATIRLQLSKLQKEKDSLEVKRFESNTAIDSLRTNISIACINQNNIDDLMESLEASEYLIKNLPDEENLKKLIVFVNNMVVQNNSYTLDYVPLNGNMIDLTITIKSKDSLFKYYALPQYKNDTLDKPLKIEIPIVGKQIFASFSSGSFIALGKNLQNKTYAWQETVGNNNTATDTNYTLVESGYTLPAMGFCALGNLEWKASRSFGIGGSFGVGLSIEKSPRLTYLGGASLFFGEMRQFTTTFGFAGMQVNRLTNNFQTVADNQVIYTSRPDIQYFKEFKVGAFISLTYTPFNVSKNKTVKSQEK